MVKLQSIGRQCYPRSSAFIRGSKNHQRTAIAFPLAFNVGSLD